MSVEFINDVGYTYSVGTPFERKALCNINLKIEDGEFVGLIGHTGCGKSTMVQLIDGLLVPDTGNILLDGKDINDVTYDKNELRRKVGIVFQFPEYQLFEKTVEKDVAFGLKHFGLSKDEIENSVRNAVEAVGFDFNKIRHRSPLGLSGGEKRRVAIAGVIAAKPKVLILDEPVAGLDPMNRNSFFRLIRRLNENGTTIIMISHNMDAIAENADRIVLLDNGKKAKDCSAGEYFSSEGTCEVKRITDALAARGLPIKKGTYLYDDLLSELKKTLQGGCNE